MHKAEVLYLNHVSQVSGAEASLLSLLAHLDTGSFRPVVGVPGEGPLLDQLRAADIETVVLPHPRLRRSQNPLTLASQYLALRRGAAAIASFVAEAHVDLVHANALSSAIAATYALRGAVPVVWHVRDLRLPRRPTRWVARQVDALIAISQAVATALDEVAPESAGKVAVVHNGVDVAAFAPRNSRRRVLDELGLPEDARLVGGVGQLVPWKRWDRFLAVGADVVARVPGVHLLVIGSDLFGDHPRYADELRTRAEDLAIGKTTHFMGFRKDIPDLVSALDVMVHCTEQEPLGRAIMEAMSLQTPVVAVGAGGPAEIIVDEESGLLAPPKNTYAIADRVVRVLRDPELARRLGRGGRARVETAFTPPQGARLTEELYREILWETGSL